MAMDDAGQLHFRYRVLTTRLTTLMIFYMAPGTAGQCSFQHISCQNLSIAATRTLHDLGQHSG